VLAEGIVLTILMVLVILSVSAEGALLAVEAVLTEEVELAEETVLVNMWLVAEGFFDLLLVETTVVALGASFEVSAFAFSISIFSLSFFDNILPILPLNVKIDHHQHHHFYNN